jgi:UDP-2,3-diacylglucosamine hydrolase
MTLPARSLALFISDLHLQPSHPRTSAAFFAFLKERAMAAESLYLLGDIFEYWAGDDDLGAMHPQLVAKALRAVSDAGTRVYWIAGNRDFLVGKEFAAAAGLTLLEEPHVVDIGGQRLVLVHGDAQCTGDTKYMAFRAMVREPAWQQQFLAMPLEKRKEIIAGLRQGSKEANAGKSYDIMDVAPDAVAELHALTNVDTIIHGHTHRPALHQDGARRRYVLPDWDMDAEIQRGGWIALEAAGTLVRYDQDGVAQ